ncbi:hypothetical protein TBR22_A47170 [Luteitalea sp. TBR-22]|nr:hypothetical protein TBR22_A47170 [Luteitalea sp. TBR-22]
MLHPSSHLKSIAIEGVAPADQSLQRDERTFLAADLTEYYGGTDAHSAEAIVLVQVKYSPLRPSTPWTLSRLVSEDHAGGRAKARSSVFRKLADMFDAMAPGGAAGTPGVTLRLLTNQPLSSGLRAELQAIRLAFSQSPRAAGRRASQLPAKPRSTAVRLQKASGLSWPRFRQLMACWDLHSFDQAMLAAEESQIFSGIAGAFPDASIRVEALLSHLQTASTPGRRVDISRSDVLAFLRLREDELFPAPPVLPDDGNLFSTVASRELRRTLEGVDGIVVVHGRAGVGKTSALQVALREHGAAVVFDCYAGGAGLRPGHERFGYTVCLVQLINELERRFRTSILATTQLSYRPLLRRFEEAVRAAASVASSEGKRLVVAIDAVDNAIEQRRRSISNDDPFLPLLWEVVWPKNCAIALSFRTENEGDVVPPGVSPAKRVEVLGFSEPELSKLATTRSAVIPSGDIAFLHQRTRGNPRVAAKVLDELAEAPNVSARQLIESTARATAFDYYEQELGRRLAAADLRAALAVLYELRQPPALDTLAAALGRAEADLRRGLGALSFGVHVTDVDTVRWNDQDFLDWVGERLKGERTTAQQRIADYCIGRFAVDAYARWNLSYHFLAAGRHDELLQWWSTPGRIEAQKLAAQPHEERVLEDIRAVITAAVRLGRDEDAILWLFRAAALAGGRDAFSDALSSNVEVAVDADLVGLLDDEVTAGATRPAAGRGGSPHRRRTGRRANADEDFRLASALARRPERREDAARLFHRAAAVKQEEYAAHPQSGGRLYMDVWAAVARYHVRVNGLERALRWATRSSSRPWSWQMAAVAAADWRAGQVSDPFGIINVARINGPAKCGALLGVLSARPADSPAGSGLSDLKSAWVRRSVRTIKRQLGRSPALRTEFSGGHTLPHSNVLASAFLDAVEQLTAANLMVDARSLLQVWAPPKPLDWLPSIVEPYLRWHALSEALGVTKFDPDANEHPPRGAVASEKKPDDSEHQRLRREMKALYPALRARALAWAGARDATAAIRAALSQEHHVDQAYVISQSTTAARLLEGVIALQKRDDKLVQEILDALERGRRGRRDDLDVLMPEVLSQDSRYLGVADRLVREELARCRPPSVPGPEAVGRLLALYKPARRIDQELARQVIEQARDVAGEVDSLAPDRAAALERITAAACSLSDSGPDATLLDRICALTGYWLGISQEGVSVHWAIERLAGRDPVAAVERASILDRDGLYPISRASMAIVSGALSTGVGSRGELWPLLEIGAETREFPKVAKNVIEGLFGERNGVAGVALRSVSRLIRIRAAEGRSDGLRELIECASWVEALGETGEANGLRAIADAIGADIDTTQSRQDGPSWPGENENAEPEIVSRVLSLNRHSARRALEVLEAATSEELASIATAQFGRLVATLARDLPIGDRRRVAQVIERWAGTGAYRIDEAVVLLNALVEQASDSVVPEDVRLDVANALAHLLNPDVIERASFDWEPRLSAAIFSGSWASQEERRRTLMEKVAVSLTDLPAGSLFRVFARVASLLDPSAAVRTVESVVQETMNSAPYQYRAVPVGVAPQRTTAVLLARCLSHPSLSARWAALYGVVSGLCDSQGVLGSSESAEGQRAGGVTLLEGLMREFDDESQPMWAAAREWLAFALLHVAGRSPKMLKPFADSLLRHALSADFPHVKIRAHLSGAIRAANAAAALELSPDTLRALEAINRPQGEVHKDAAFVAAPLLARGLLESDGIEIDDWDTKRYWYQPMMESFPVEPRELAESVQLAAKKWSARVGVTKLGADTQRANMRDRYEWSDIDNRQGQEPRVELLEMHGARQALFLLAGDLIDQIPVRSGDWFDRWPSFMRYRARGADPELTGRWVDAPPAVPDNYGIVREPIVEWCKNRKEEAYLRELTAGVPKGWFVLSGSRQASEWNWSYSYTVDAALVDARTACSLVRLLEDPDQDAHGYLPFWEPHYDCTVLEAYEACCTGSDLAHVKGEHAGRNGRFRLFTTDIGFSQELPLHSSDSSWPGTSRRYILPSPRIADTLGWRRAFGQPSWRDSSGAEVAKYETWHVERRGRSASGQRLIIRADQVGETLLAGGSDGPLDLIVQVRLRREERRGSDRVGQLDMGSGRVFLWSQISNGIV